MCSMSARVGIRVRGFAADACRQVGLDVARFVSCVSSGVEWAKLFAVTCRLREAENESNSRNSHRANNDEFG